MPEQVEGRHGVSSAMLAQGTMYINLCVAHPCTEMSRQCGSRSLVVGEPQLTLSLNSWPLQELHGPDKV